MDKKKLEVMKMVVNGEVSIAYAAAKLGRSEKTIRRRIARRPAVKKYQIFFQRHANF